MLTADMHLMTATRLRTYRRCPREDKFRYIDHLDPVNVDPNLGFGSLFHVGLEAWLPCAAAPADRVRAAIDAMRAKGADAFDLVRAEELMVAYAVRWGDVAMQIIGVEVEFNAPLINPETGRASRTFRLAGKLDAVVRLPNGETWIMEHKTTSEDVSPGSAYFQRLRMDGQVSQYYDGAEALGHEVAGVLYDVIVKPTQRPLKATPPEARKYTKAGALYAAQRLTDETPEEYRLRIRAAILENPGAYFARADVVRLDAERREHQLDAWQLTSQIREAERTGCHPRNPESCIRYGKNCAFLAACTGMASLDDTTLYRVRDVAHPELSGPQERSGNHGSSNGNGITETATR